MSYNFIYDHKGKLVCDKSGSLILLPPTKLWRETRKSEDEYDKKFTVTENGNSLSFYTSHGGYDIYTPGRYEDPPEDHYHNVSIEASYVTICSPDSRLRVSAEVEYTPIRPDVEDAAIVDTAAIGYLSLYCGPFAGRDAHNNGRFITIEKYWTVATSELSDFSETYSPSVMGLDYRTEVSIELYIGTQGSMIVYPTDSSTWARKHPFSYTLKIDIV